MFDLKAFDLIHKTLNPIFKAFIKDWKLIKPAKAQPVAYSNKEL